MSYFKLCAFFSLDRDGDLVEGASVQETGVWDVINKNYLRAPETIHMPLAIEDLPDGKHIALNKSALFIFNDDEKYSYQFVFKDFDSQ